MQQKVLTGRSYTTVAGKAYRTAQSSISDAGAGSPSALARLYLLIVVILPTLALIVAAFRKFMFIRDAASLFDMRQYSLMHFHSIFDNPLTMKFDLQRGGGRDHHRVFRRRARLRDRLHHLGGNSDLGGQFLAQEFLRVFLVRHRQQPFELVEGHEHLGVNAFINQYAPAGVVTVTRYHTSYHTMIKRGLVDWPESSRIKDLERLSLTSAGFRVSTSNFIDAVTREDFALTESAPVLANFTAPPPPVAPDATPVTRENLVIFAGRLVLEHKRPDLAARAFAAIASEFPTWRIEFAGADMPLPKGRPLGSFVRATSARSAPIAGNTAAYCRPRRWTACTDGRK